MPLGAHSPYETSREEAQPQSLEFRTEAGKGTKPPAYPDPRKAICFFNSFEVCHRLQQKSALTKPTGCFLGFATPSLWGWGLSVDLQQTEQAGLRAPGWVL